MVELADFFESFNHYSRSLRGRCFKPTCRGFECGHIEVLPGRVLIQGERPIPYRTPPELTGILLEALLRFDTAQVR